MKTIIVAVAALLFAACATPRAAQDQEVAEQKSYRVGSHLPVKDKSDGSSAVNSTTISPVAPSPVYVPGKGGGAN